MSACRVQQPAEHLEAGGIEPVRVLGDHQSGRAVQAGQEIVLTASAIRS